jgi:hypothetical protein
LLNSFVIFIVVASSRSSVRCGLSILSKEEAHGVARTTSPPRRRDNDSNVKSVSSDLKSANKHSFTNDRYLKFHEGEKADGVMLEENSSRAGVKVLAN